MSGRKSSSSRWSGRNPLSKTSLKKCARPGIVEMIRTGVVSMGRGTRIHDSDFQRPALTQAAAEQAANGNGRIV